MRACVSLDLDDLWTYLKTHGDPAWAERPTFLPVFIPRVLELLDRLDLRITFFVVGADAACPEHRALFGDLARAGHEFGNHSHEHDPWLHLYPSEELEADLRRAEEAIREATGHGVVGFRGPGFSWTPTLLEVLAARGYGFDASTLPTYLAPLARRYFLARSALSDLERERRAGLFGSWRDGLRPVGPYYWRLPSGAKLLEIPVTTIPGLKLPFHMSYLLFLRRRSPRLMQSYLRAAVLASRTAGVGPSFLLHPLDLLGGEEVPGLGFFPGMDLSRREKTAAFADAFRILGDHFELVPMGRYAADLAGRGTLPLRDPQWQPPGPTAPDRAPARDAGAPALPAK